MTKYLLLKHYRGAPKAVSGAPMVQWTPEEIEDHLPYMADFATRLEGTGEYVDGQALSPEGAFVGELSAAPGAGGKPIVMRSRHRRQRSDGRLGA